MNISLRNGPLGFFSKPQRKKVGIGGLLSSLAFGLVFTGAGWLFLYDDFQSAGWPTANGTVSSVRTSQDDGNTLYTPTVSYQVDNISYTTTSSVSTSSRSDIGDASTVSYNPADPSEAVIRMEGAALLIFLFPVLGVAIVLWSLITFWLSVRRGRAIKSLMQRGTKITGVVTNVEDHSTSNHSGSRVVVTATDPTGQVQHYLSDWIQGSTFGLVDFQTQAVPMDVYLDPADPTSYYVDISDIPSLTPDKIAALLKRAVGQPAPPPLALDMAAPVPPQASPAVGSPAQPPSAPPPGQILPPQQ